MKRWLRPGVQPSLAEMLDDPVVRVVMQRDDVSRTQLEKLVRNVAQRVAAAEGGAKAPRKLAPQCATQELSAASLCEP